MARSKPFFSMMAAAAENVTGEEQIDEEAPQVDRLLLLLFDLVIGDLNLVAVVCQECTITVLAPL